MILIENLTIRENDVDGEFSDAIFPELAAIDRSIAMRSLGTIRPNSDSRLRMLFAIFARAWTNFCCVLRNRRG